MTEYDAEMYESFSSRVRRQVQSLRVILDSLQARGKERVWLRNQTSGELDDSKLIEGLTGERAIYKKRGEEDPEVWQRGLCCLIVFVSFCKLMKREVPSLNKPITVIKLMNFHLKCGWTQF